MKWLPENGQLLLISFTSVITTLNLIWIPLTLLLYKNNPFPLSVIIPDVTTKLLSWRLWILLYVVLMGILVSAVISITDFGIFITDSGMVVQYLSDTISGRLSFLSISSILMIYCCCDIFCISKIVHN